MVVEDVPVELVAEWLINPAIVLIVLLIAFIFGSSVVKPFVTRMVRRRDETGHLAKPLSRVALYLTVFLGLGIGLAAGGYRDLFTVLGTIVAAATIAGGFAMRDTLSALVAGVFIFLDRPFRIGDVITWDDELGRVKDIRIRTTRIETFDNELMSVPNDEITGTAVTNLSANPQRRHSVSLGIGYDDDPQEAKQILLDILDGTEHVLAEPEPQVVIDELGDSAIHLLVRYWMNEPSPRGPAAVRDEIYQRGIDAFDEEGISIPYPTRTIDGDTLRIEDGRDK